MQACNTKTRKTSLLVNTRAFWPYPNATAIAATSGILQCPSPKNCFESLEFEALAAVHRLSIAVRNISVSEMLPRTPELIFVNVTTMEGQPYCLELTAKGWRITSLRTDCMQGDFTRMELFTVYYNSIYDLMSVISPSYKQQAKTIVLKKSNADSDEEFDNKEEVSSLNDVPTQNFLSKDIQLCKKCRCASVAMPLLSSTTSSCNDTDNDSDFHSCDNSNSQTNSINNVVTCRCGTMRRGSTVGSQVLDDDTEKKRLILQHLSLLNQKQ